MEYKGYHINAQVTINESWDFKEKKDGKVNLTTMTGRTYFVQASSKIDYFSIQDPEGTYLEIRSLSPASARAFIDEHIRRNNEQLVSNCHHAAIKCHKLEHADWYYVCTVCGDPCDVEERESHE